MSGIGGLKLIFGNLRVPKGYPKIIKSLGTGYMGIIPTYLTQVGSDRL